jgi:hypothetical protein
MVGSLASHRLLYSLTSAFFTYFYHYVGLSGKVKVKKGAPKAKEKEKKEVKSVKTVSKGARSSFL